MVSKYLILTLLLILIPSSVYAQVADQTVGGIIVPKFTSTQNNYCFNGHCITSIVSIPANYSKSVSKYPVILVSLSKSCEILNKYNLTGCKPIKELIPFDNSNQRISGKFINNNGIYSRTNPQVKNNWLAYTTSSHMIICVECYFDITATSKSQQIILQPNSYSYVNKSETETNGNWYSFSNRYMQGCDTATIANIPGLFEDTLRFMSNGCNTTFTSYHSQTNHTRTLQAFSYNNPFSTLHQDSYLKTIMNGHTYDFGNKTSGGKGPMDCIRHKCNFSDPYKKVGY